MNREADGLMVFWCFRLVAWLILCGLPMMAMESPDDLSLNELEQRLKSIDVELAQLASASFQGGAGPNGFRSASHDTDREDEWIRVDFDQEYPIDEIVLVPAIWRDTRAGFRADGFPLEFRILAGTGDDEDGEVVAAFSPEDRLTPRTAPVIVRCEGTVASWIKIHATQLSPRAWDGRYILQLSEILAFDAEENVALRQRVTTSSLGSHGAHAPRDKSFLVDGFLPYLMDASQGDQSIAFVSEIKDVENPGFALDLGSPYPINRVHIHSADLSDTVPQTAEVDFGIPRHMVIEGSLKPDFSDASTLVDYRMASIYDTGPIIIRRFPERVCRFVRLVALDPYIADKAGISGAQCGFAELEVFSNGQNMALGIMPDSDLDVVSPERTVTALTDGRNLYGQILSIRRWMNELTRRHDLEAERPGIVAALGRRHEWQKSLVQLLTWLVALLAGGIIFTVLVTRIHRMRQVDRIRERLAADLHDELGANLHTIGLLSDLAAESGGSPEQLATLHRRIRSETERSGLAVRNCTDMLKAAGEITDFEENMRRASRRIMSKLEHEITIEGIEHIDALDSRTRYDLFLFYKECLVNISRHADASEFRTLLHADGRSVRLVISDNGSGISDSADSKVPSSLQRRARLLKGKVSVDSHESGGTQVTLILMTPNRRKA